MAQSSHLGTHDTHAGAFCIQVVTAEADPESFTKFQKLLDLEGLLEFVNISQSAVTLQTGTPAQGAPILTHSCAVITRVRAT